MRTRTALGPTIVHFRYNVHGYKSLMRNTTEVGLDHMRARNQVEAPDAFQNPWLLEIVRSIDEALTRESASVWQPVASRCSYRGLAPQRRTAVCFHWPQAVA